MISFIIGLLAGVYLGMLIVTIVVAYKITALQNKINRAIKYIKTTNFWGLYEDTPMEEVLYGEELLEILGGEINYDE